MDKAEARRILREHLSPYRQKPYAELARLIAADPHSFEAAAPSGRSYQIEITCVWDDPGRRADIRVIGSIDDGGLRALWPVSEDFIKAPNGCFVGEDEHPWE